MKRTAIQHAIDCFETLSNGTNSKFHKEIYDASIDILSALLETERQDLIEAANWNGYYDNPKVGSLTGEQYYNEKFNNKQS